MVKQICFIEHSLTYRGLPYCFLYSWSLGGINYLITYFVPINFNEPWLLYLPIYGKVLNSFIKDVWFSSINNYLLYSDYFIFVVKFPMYLDSTLLLLINLPDWGLGLSLRESIPRQVDKKSRGPYGERGLEFSRRKKGQTFFPSTFPRIIQQ